MNGVYYKRNLPHYQPGNADYFVTFRLANSLPKKVIDNLKNEYSILINETEKINNLSKRKRAILRNAKQYFRKFDNLLDGSQTGPLWLKEEPIANIIYESIIYRDKKKYDLHCFTIMPNHVHVVFSIEDVNVGRIADSTARNSVSGYRVTKILQDLKKFTAIESNKILKRSGQFWQNESYDHVIRNSTEYRNVINYVINNPVKAGLVDNAENWKWTYIADPVKEFLAK